VERREVKKYNPSDLSIFFSYLFLLLRLKVRLISHLLFSGKVLPFLFLPLLFSFYPSGAEETGKNKSGGGVMPALQLRSSPPSRTCEAFFNSSFFPFFLFFFFPNTD